LRRICGVDLTAVHGVSASLAQTIVIEIGTDMTKFPNEKHFCSWLGLAPKNEISGGKVLKTRTLKTHNRASQAFRLAAGSLMRAGRLRLWCFLPQTESQAWTGTSSCGDSPLDCQNCLPDAEIQSGI
jgi:transposase